MKFKGLYFCLFLLAAGLKNKAKLSYAGSITTERIIKFKQEKYINTEEKLKTHPILFDDWQPTGKSSHQNSFKKTKLYLVL